MAEAGDTMEKIATDEMERLRSIGKVQNYIKDKDTAKLRQAAMLTQMDGEMKLRRETVVKRLKIEQNCVLLISLKYSFSSLTRGGIQVEQVRSWEGRANMLGAHSILHIKYTESYSSYINIY